MELLYAEHFKLSRRTNFSKKIVIRELRARAKITSHFKRRCILPGGVVKARNMLDISALSRLASWAPQRLKSVN